jgi:hypothetical protein
MISQRHPTKRSRVSNRRMSFEIMEQRQMLSVSLGASVGASPTSTVDSHCSNAGWLSAPTHVKATFDPCTNQMQICWKGVDCAKSYTVYRSTTNCPDKAASIGSCITGTSFVDKCPTPGATYYYWVKANNGSKSSCFSCAAKGVDTDQTVTVTKCIPTDTILKALGSLQWLEDDIKACIASYSGPKPSVSFCLDSLKATETETLIVTPCNTIVTGTSVITVNESGHGSATLCATLPCLGSVKVGAQFCESGTLQLTESYCASTGWTIILTSAKLTLDASAKGYAKTQFGKYTGEIDLDMACTACIVTGSDKVTITPTASLSVCYSVNGPGLHRSGALDVGPTTLPSWTLDLSSIPV